MLKKRHMHECELGLNCGSAPLHDTADRYPKSQPASTDAALKGNKNMRQLLNRAAQAAGEVTVSQRFCLAPDPSRCAWWLSHIYWTNDGEAGAPGGRQRITRHRTDRAAVAQLTHYKKGRPFSSLRCTGSSDASTRTRDQTATCCASSESINLISAGDNFCRRRGNRLTSSSSLCSAPLESENRGFSL